jgi:HIP---CoA ligase
MPQTSALTLPHTLARAARDHGERPAIIAEAARLTFRELEAAVHQAAAAFLALGVSRGDRVALWAPNSPEWIIAALGASSAGAILVPLNTRLKGQEAAYILRRSSARLLVTIDTFLGVSYPQLLAAEPLPTLERTLLLSNASGPHLSWGQFLALGHTVSFGDVLAARDRVSPEDAADIMFTSGTTGLPKGVICTHEQDIRVSTAWCETVGLQPDDRYLIVNPFFHTFGFKAGWLACLLSGATAYPVAVFDAGDVIDRIGRAGITVLPGAPTLYQSLLMHDKSRGADLSSLRLAVTGAASVPPSLIHRMRTELGFRTVVTAYGLTESTGVVTMCPAGTDDETVATRCGLPIAGVEIQCVDDKGSTVPPGAPGEVLVRGYNVMKGYFEDPEATAQAIDARGWLHTGDIGVIDERGFLRITDRKKDLFIVGGFNCYPAEIERMLCEHPAIAQAAVIGVPDERMGEVGKAFVVARPGADLGVADLIDWCRAHMANYKVPRFVEIVPSLPLNAAGKVQKFVLREGNAG